MSVWSWRASEVVSTIIDILFVLSSLARGPSPAWAGGAVIPAEAGIQRCFSLLNEEGSRGAPGVCIYPYMVLRWPIGVDWQLGSRQMTAHKGACDESQQLCHLLVEELRKRVPKLQCRETKQWCALFEPPRNRLAYISHRKTSAVIEVWCAGDVNDLMGHGGIDIVPRTKIRGGWEQRFPGRFFLSTAREIRSACALLYEVSYRAS